jgi:SAM-dependent methyltransferase
MITKNKLIGPIFIGRSWKEYVKMFNLSETDLTKNILDCAAGASSFTAQMNIQGYKVKAVDLLFDQDALVLKQRCIEHLELLIESLSQNKDMFIWTCFPDPQSLKEHRIKSCHEFYEDYQQNPQRYIKGNLTNLPFPNNHFNISLSSHLLFIYDHRLDLNFHIKAVQEMLRVSQDELRIYPLVKRKFKKSELISPVIEAVEEIAFPELVKVKYQFRKGGDEMLIFKKY